MPITLPDPPQGISGHGCILEVNLDENGNVQAEWVEVMGLSGDLAQGFSRNWIEMLSHNVDIDEGTGGILRGGEITATLNYRQQSASHKGLRQACLKKTFFGFRFTGVEGRIADDGTDRILASGECLSFNETNPVDGARQATVVLRRSGNLWIDNVLVGPVSYT